MNKESLAALTVDELLARYIKLALKREEAERGSQLREQNRAIYGLFDIEAELKARPGDERTALTRLFHHPNIQVRVEAALAAGFVAPVTSRQVLEDIAKSCRAPQAYQARERLENLDSGFFVPS